MSLTSRDFSTPPRVRARGFASTSLEYSVAKNLEQSNFSVYHEIETLSSVNRTVSQCVSGRQHVLMCSLRFREDLANRPDFAIIEVSSL